MRKSFLRKTVAAVMLLLPSCVFAQTYHGSFTTQPYSFDLRDLMRDKSQKSDSDILRTMTRRGISVTGGKTLWIDRINYLPDNVRQFYDRYMALAQQVLDGGSNCLSDPDNDPVNTVTDQSGSVYLPVLSVTRKIEYTVPEDIAGNPDALGQYAMNALLKDYNEHVVPETESFLNYADMCISYDLPEVFWIEHTTNYTSNFSYRYGFLHAPGRDSLEYTSTTMFLLKADNLDFRIPEYRSPGAVSAGVSEYNGLIDSILSNVPNTSRYDQILYLNDWLTGNNAYSTAFATGDFPQIVLSPISALRGTNGESGPICEGYSRAFKVLCDKLGIPCILAAGDAFSFVGDQAEPHMWNEVMMNDNKWYAVDVTWNDPVVSMSGTDPKASGQECHDWILLGKNTVVSRNPQTLTFGQSHINNPISGYMYSSNWDCNTESYIEDDRFDPVTGVERIGPARDDDVIYSILGVRVDRKPHELEPGLYIINGRKVVVK